MYRFKNILVSLSLNGDESDLIKYVSHITHLAHSEKVTFVHVADRLDIPVKVKEKYPWLMEPIDEAALERLKHSVEGSYDGYAQCQVNTEVIEGIELYEILKKAEAEDVDLIACARRSPDAVFAIHLARKAPCSLLIIPPKPTVDFRTVLVPVDFSKYSSYAVNVAAAFAKAQGLEKVDLLHSYSLMPGSHRATVPESELLAMAEDHAQFLAKDFVEQQDLQGLEASADFVMSSAPAHATVSWAREIEADLIVAGCRGKDAITASLLGSNAEQLIRLSHVPLVAVKEKGTGRNLLQSILKRD